MDTSSKIAVMDVTDTYKNALNTIAGTALAERYDHVQRLHSLGNPPHTEFLIALIHVIGSMERFAPCGSVYRSYKAP